MAMRIMGAGLAAAMVAAGLAAALAAGSAQAKAVAECLAVATSALTQAHAGMGAPAASDTATLERIVEAAKGDLRKLVWGDPDARVSTSVLGGRIRIRASCGGEERSGDWTPPR